MPDTLRYHILSRFALYRSSLSVISNSLLLIFFFLHIVQLILVLLMILIVMVVHAGVRVCALFPIRIEISSVADGVGEEHGPVFERINSEVVFLPWV
jgi:hypothetical protein